MGHGECPVEVAVVLLLHVGSEVVAGNDEVALGPLINLGTQHDGKECSDLDEKSLTTFLLLNEDGERK